MLENRINREAEPRILFIDGDGLKRTSILKSFYWAKVSWKGAIVLRLPWGETLYQILSQKWYIVDMFSDVAKHANAETCETAKFPIPQLPFHHIKATHLRSAEKGPVFIEKRRLG
jgi:hypothetical protein